MQLNIHWLPVRQPGCGEDCSSRLAFTSTGTDADLVKARSSAQRFHAQASCSCATERIGCRLTVRVSRRPGALPGYAASAGIGRDCAEPTMGCPMTR
jgi:hypothetical protein